MSEEHKEMAEAFVQGVAVFQQATFEAVPQFVQAETKLNGLDAEYCVGKTRLEFHFWPTDDGVNLPVGAAAVVAEFARNLPRPVVDLASGVCKSPTDTLARESIYMAFEPALPPTPPAVERILSKLAAKL
jgi:hypothetical protein